VHKPQEYQSFASLSNESKVTKSGLQGVEGVGLFQKKKSSQPNIPHQLIVLILLSAAVITTVITALHDITISSYG